jgi:Fe2+ transport system protein FeoA
MKTLADLKPGQTGIVDGFRNFGPLVHRIMQMGVLKNTELELVRRAPFGDPIEIRVKDYNLSLRREQASLIMMRNL